MATKKHTEYGAPLASMDRNNTRALFMKEGRYFGFDSIESGTGNNIPIRITHTDKRSYVDNSNSYVEVAVVITKQGLVIETDEEPNVEVLINDTGTTQYQVLYLDYTWVDNPSGASPIYGVYAQTTTKPTTPPALTETKVPLGYFTIPDGATSFSSVSYTPYPKPNLANKDDIDTSNFAIINGNNIFSGKNSEGYEDIDTANIVDSTVLAEDFMMISLSNSSNVFIVKDLQGNRVYQIGRIAMSTPIKGERIHIVWGNYPGKPQIGWVEGGNLSIPIALRGYTYQPYGEVTTFRWNGNYWILEAANQALGELLNSLNSVDNAYTEAIQWTNKVSYEDPNFNVRLDVGNRGSEVWVRGSIRILQSVSSGYTTVSPDTSVGHIFKRYPILAASGGAYSPSATPDDIVLFSSPLSRKVVLYHGDISEGLVHVNSFLLYS
jgi:hypothetical protein